MKKFKKLILVSLAGLLILTAGFYSYKIANPVTSANDTTSINRTFTIQELAQYDGTDSTKPIYLAMNGLVYDVTAGKNYYEPGGTYHWLAGKDSSKDLNLIGGDIIKRKYPVVGKLVQ